ncbi:carbohydrate esterase family 1 protein [Piromyces sp. E2]|nr:carbohydrate esterase family 1 protein [Piromyces sp. E2]|eukprot:OUM61703.1 carbohydrate esterase family 1 protein [Piromyces sp. E2]
MFKKLQKQICWTLSLSALALSVINGSPVENPTYGITLRDTKEKFTVFSEGSAASDIVEADDGSVSWIATAAGGAGGGVAFYAKPSKEEINIGNYESIDIEMEYNPVEGKWNENAQNPSFCMRMLPWDSTGMFGGYEDLEYVDTDAKSGTFKYTFKIPSDFANKIISSSDYDSILGFAIKFNDYNRGLTDGDQIKVQLKNVTFNPKEGAAKDKAFDDGLTDAQRGTVIEINYPSRDYSVEESALTDADKYKKHAWVYLPAGYDASDKDTKYPVFVLLHGLYQNENTWGLSNKGRGGKIKGYMDRGMASGEVEKFILVAATGISTKNWGPNGSGANMDEFNFFQGEFRNDLLPYIRANFNVKEGRDNVALAGLSMGGGQTLNIGVGECLDLISNYGAFSPAVFVPGSEFVSKVDSNADFNNLKIHNLYVTCGDNDALVYEIYPSYVEALKSWNRVENFKDYTFPGGTHDFPVWYKGFSDFIKMVFKNYATETETKPTETVAQPTETVAQPTETVAEPTEIVTKPAEPNKTLKCKAKAVKKTKTVTRCKAKKN